MPLEISVGGALGKHAPIIFASTLAKGSLLSHALRKSFDSIVSPGALFGQSINSDASCIVKIHQLKYSC